MKRSGPTLLVGLLIGLLVACGGGREDAPKSNTRRAAAVFPSQDSLPDAEAQELFRWAQATWPDLFPDSPPLSHVEYQGRTYLVRSYVNGNHLGVADGQVYGLGAFTNGLVQGFGPVADYSRQVCAFTGCGALEAGAVDETVTIAPPTVRSYQDGVFVNGWTSQVTLAGEVLGDPASLAGRPIYAVVEDPSQLFQPEAWLYVENKGARWEYSLTLRPRQLIKVGRYTGTLKAFACLDAKCTSRFKGIPVAIPYDVRVSPPPLTTLPPSIEIAGKALVAPDPVVLLTLPVDSPMNAVTQVNMKDSELQPGEGRLSTADPRTGLDNDPVTGGRRLRLFLSATKAGTYRGRVVVSGSTLAPGGYRDSSFDQSVEIVYRSHLIPH